MIPSGYKQIYLEFLPRYQQEIKSFNPNDLQTLIEREVHRSVANYRKLKNPKTCSASTYKEYWVYDQVRRDFILKTLKKISINEPNPDPHSQALVSYLSIIPIKLSRLINQKLSKTQPGNRRAVWKEFKLPVKKLETLLQKIAVNRNILAQEKGYASFIEFSLNNSKIPSSDYKKFKNIINILINKLNKQLPKTRLPSWSYSVFSWPCYICKVTNMSYKKLGDVFEYVQKRSSLLKKYYTKININSGTRSATLYKKESDSFQITIDYSNSFNHQVSDLIHELGHVHADLINLRNGYIPLKLGRYQAEFEAINYHSKISRSLSHDLYKAYFGQVLLTLIRVMFEIELYTKPNQNLSKLYASNFNKCFKKCNQKSNPGYLIDDRIISAPLSSLPHMVAFSKIFS